MNTVTPFFLKATPAQTWGMRISVGTNFLVMAFCTGYLILQFGPSGITWPYIVVAVLIGYFIADFTSGLVHWSMDTWFDEAMLGRVLAIAREHHTHPQNILGYGFLEHSALGSAPSAIFIGSASIATALFPASRTTYFLIIIGLIAATCLFFGNSFHNLSHKRSRSPVIRFAQKWYLVMSTEHHWVHHRGDQTIRYCVINGWANYVCDPLRVWRGLEWLVHALTGAEPRCDDLAWQRRYKETGTLVGPRN
jgi:hypothetical protein